MTQLVYRGVPVVKREAAAQTLADQMRKPSLVYRGVAHDGERAVEPTRNNEDLIYRGAKLA